MKIHITDIQYLDERLGTKTNLDFMGSYFVKFRIWFRWKLIIMVELFKHQCITVRLLLSVRPFMHLLHFSKNSIMTSSSLQKNDVFWYITCGTLLADKTSWANTKKFQYKICNYLVQQKVYDNYTARLPKRFVFTKLECHPSSNNLNTQWRSRLDLLPV